MQSLVQIQGNIIDLSKIWKIDNEIVMSHDEDGHIFYFELYVIDKGRDIVTINSPDHEEEDRKKLISIREQLVEMWNRFNNSGSSLIIPEIKPLL